MGIMLQVLAVGTSEEEPNLAAGIRQFKTRA